MPKLIKNYQKLSINYYLLILCGLIQYSIVLGYSLSENAVIAESKQLTPDESNENSVLISKQHVTGEHHRHHNKHQQENHPYHLFRHQHHQKKHHNSNANFKLPKDDSLFLNGSNRLEKAINEFEKYQFERIQNTTDIIQIKQNFDDIPVDSNINDDIIKDKDDILLTSKPLRPSTPTTSTPFKYEKPTKKSHHLRHHNRHHQVWEERVFPALRHHRTTSLPVTDEPIKKKSNSLQKLNKNIKRNFNTTNSRYFDRDGLYSTDKIKNHGSKFNNKKTLNQEYSTNYFNKKSFDQQQYNIDDSFYSDDSSNDFGVIIKKKTNLPVKKSKKKKLITKTLESELDDYYDDDYYDNNDDDSGYDDDLDDENNSKFNNFNKIQLKVKNHHINKQDTDDIYSRSYIPGTLTKQKYEMLGTHEAIQDTKKSYITNQKHHRALATQHITKMSLESSCSVPKPKVEKIQHDTAKLYVPHCTILHRCGDDTGCCMSDTKTCVAKRTQDVDLYFFVRSIDSKQGAIERITFKNHTECHCVRKPPIQHTNFILEPATIRKATVLDCNCPKLYEKILQDDGNCRCDCSSSNSNCDWLKRGMEHFSMVDRKCILEGRCKPPTCEFGSYVKKYGRCPRKDDKMSSNYSSRNFH